MGPQPPSSRGGAVPGGGPPTPPPRQSLNEAAMAAGAAAAAGKKAKAGDFWATWGNKFNSHSANVRAAAEGWVTGARLELSKAQKWHMPIKVDVDFMNPMFASVREGIDQTWARIPLPVQHSMKYVAVGLATAMVIHKIEHGQLVTEKADAKKLQEQVMRLIGERDKQAEVIKGLRANALAPRSASELKLAAAVAEASAAAAQASTAAAMAAEAAARTAQGCVVQKPPSRPQRPQ